MQKEKECYLCRMAADRIGYTGDLPHTGLHKHHVIYGKGNRKKSEKFGLWVYLCAERHHEYGPEAVHNNKEIRNMLSARAQKAFEREFPKLHFIQEFGKNYTEEKEEVRQQEKDDQGIVMLDIDLGKLPF